MARGRAPAAGNDTIAAVATAVGAGGIGVVRISGPRSREIARAMIGKNPQARKVHFATMRDADGEALDRGLALYFAAPKSYTGEDVLELQAHGSQVVLDLILRRAIELGARLARPGEFSERAYLNGKLDLTQAEAVADLIASGSESAARAAMRSLEGDFSHAVDRLFEALVRLRAWLEAALDFPEEEIDFLSAPQLGDQLAALQAGTRDLLQGARRGVVLRDGLHVVIVGRPNAGKSSLLNALARSERAIVTPVAGTTRDVLRESVHFDGIGLTLVDTAGLRESDDPVEVEGIRRARAELARADVAILVTDDKHANADRELLRECGAAATRVIVHNKIDLSGEAPTRGDAIANVTNEVHIHLSAKTGAGLDLLRAELARLGGRGAESHGAFSARRRHVDALERVAGHLRSADTQLRLARAGELAAEELRQAQHALGEITGEYSSDDLLGAIFSTFCIGK
ncbi:MAG: tRNA uridine-5-carboxymethylaminomethyl(34) synthesis GTPase MnmE [Proteobacteria bacterium]|nr:tRNA uridine-5-carboxymethylaminomethyl(34) synthesis GTPase MnmE [Pseudomonadota bacterium]